MSIFIIVIRVFVWVFDLVWIMRHLNNNDYILAIQNKYYMFLYNWNLDITNITVNLLLTQQYQIKYILVHSFIYNQETESIICKHNWIILFEKLIYNDGCVKGYITDGSIMNRVRICSCILNVIKYWNFGAKYVKCQNSIKINVLSVKIVSQYLF
jgi:hypothetical protein